MSLDQGILLAIVIPTASVLAGMLVNKRQLDFFRSGLSAKIDRVDSRIDSLRAEISARFEAQTQALLRVEQVLDARL